MAVSRGWSKCLAHTGSWVPFDTHSGDSKIIEQLEKYMQLIIGYLVTKSALILVEKFHFSLIL